MKCKTFERNHLDEAGYQWRKARDKNLPIYATWIYKETAFLLESVITLKTPDKGYYIEVTLVEVRFKLE
jgi:hypothetical protein